MSISRIAVCAALIAFGACQAQAQTVPPNALIAGGTRLDIVRTTFGGSCYVDRGFSGFQRNNSDPQVVITFSSLVDSGVWDLSGAAVMTFTSSSAGTILFKNTAMTVPPGVVVPVYPANVRNPQFSNYSQTFANGALTVNFDIAFPDCTLHIYGYYIT